MLQMGLSEFQVLELKDGAEEKTPRCVLYIYEGPTRMTKTEFGREGLDIGRDPCNGLSVTEDSQMSNHHAQITFAGSAFLLEDQGSTNKFANKKHTA